MKRNRALSASVCLNLLLAGAVVILFASHHKKINIDPATPRADVASSLVPLRQLTSENPASQPTNNLILAHFDWHQVESEDYRQYLANLRSVGCPEKTIKDIIVADVNDLFASRIASLTRTNLYEYWKKEPVTRSAEQKAQLTDLFLQKQDVLKNLGVSALDIKDLLGEAFRDDIEVHELQFGFLPEAKRQQIKELLLQQAQQEIAASNSSTPVDGFEKETQARIQSLLSNEEWREYELRASTDAQSLRGILEPVALDEQEFRAVFDSWRRLKTFAHNTPEFLEAQQVAESSLQQQLGNDRFAIYLERMKLLGYPR